MEHRRKSSPERQSESDESWRKKGGGPWALATPEVEVGVSVFSDDDAAVTVIDKMAERKKKMPMKKGREREGLLMMILTVFDPCGKMPLSTSVVGVSDNLCQYRRNEWRAPTLPRVRYFAIVLAGSRYRVDDRRLPRLANLGTSVSW